MISHGRFDVISHGRFDVISHGRFDVISHGRSHGRVYNHNTQLLNMEHVGNLAEAEDVLSPTIISLFGLLSPPAEQEETCHFCFETITKGQFMVLKLPTQIADSNCRAADISPTPAASRHGHLHPKKNPSYTVPIAEPPTHTKTSVSFAYKNTPKNSAAQSAATQNFTRNAPKISQSYSHS